MQTAIEQKIPLMAKQDMVFLRRLIPVVVVPAILLLMPAPEGLNIMAWRLFAVYVGAILGLVIQPFSEPVVMLIALGICGVTLKNGSVILQGYANGTTWLVFSAVLISIAFVETGLGKRIAFHLIRMIGRTTLGLGYAGSLLDYLLAPGIPSSTARAAGITYPILRSVAVALDSEPGPSAARIGKYLSLLTYAVSATTSYAFLTAFAPNFLALKLTTEVLGITIDWMTWFKAALVPSLIMMIATPWVLYKLYPPEIKTLDNKKVAADGLAAMGPMKRAEKLLIVFFLLALLGWMFSDRFGIGATSVAIAAIAACLATRVMTWDQITASKGALTTLVWYGAIIGLAGSLGKAGFFTWLSQYIKANMDLSGYSSLTVLVVLLVVNIPVRYLFASGAAYALAMIPVFLAVGLAAGVPLLPLGLAFCFSLSYGGLTTHYGLGQGPVIFAINYVSLKEWWLFGTVLMVMHLVVNVCIGFPYWRMLGYWQ